jgi:serine/threonine-protein phosphatase PP1 catalytic subunit
MPPKKRVHSKSTSSLSTTFADIEISKTNNSEDKVTNKPSSIVDNKDTGSKKSKLIDLINNLLTFNREEKKVKHKMENTNIPFRYDINYNVLSLLTNSVKPILHKEKNLIEIDNPVYIFGDIHGQYSDLIRFLELTKLPPQVKLLFLGDYVDRGDNSIEVIALLFALKIKYPQHVYLLRGNHECPQVNKMYGFKEECQERYPTNGLKLWKDINDVFGELPIACLINKQILCVHGGISSKITSLDSIKKLPKQAIIPDDGIMCDLTWADPKKQRSEFQNSDRGVSFTFNEKALEKFIKNLNIQLVCRAHQVVDDGYKFFCNNKLVTVFSAPNYCGEVGNKGAVMNVNENMSCSFLILKPIRRKKKKFKSMSVSSQ